MIASEADDHRPIRVVVADANVLYSRILRDYLLYAATQGALEIRWSASILSEVVEHLSQNIAGFDRAAGERLIAAMNAAFPVAEADPDATAIHAVAELRLPDEDDRHVLATAVAVEADVLCTDNLKDFPIDVMNEAGVQLMSADVLLSLLVVELPEQMLAAHQLTVTRLPGATNDSTLNALRRAGAITTAEAVARLLGR